MATVRFTAMNLPSGAAHCSVILYGWGEITLAANVPVKSGKIDVRVALPEIPVAAARNVHYAADLFSHAGTQIARWLGSLASGVVEFDAPVHAALPSLSGSAAADSKSAIAKPSDPPPPPAPSKSAASTSLFVGQKSTMLIPLAAVSQLAVSNSVSGDLKTIGSAKPDPVVDSTKVASQVDKNSGDQQGKVQVSAGGQNLLQGAGSSEGATPKGPEGKVQTVLAKGAPGLDGQVAQVKALPQALVLPTVPKVEVSPTGESAVAKVGSQSDKGTNGVPSTLLVSNASASQDSGKTTDDAKVPAAPSKSGHTGTNASVEASGGNEGGLGSSVPPEKEASTPPVEVAKSVVAPLSKQSDASSASVSSSDQVNQSSTSESSKIANEIGADAAAAKGDTSGTSAIGDTKTPVSEGFSPVSVEAEAPPVKSVKEYASPTTTTEPDAVKTTRSVPSSDLPNSGPQIEAKLPPPDVTAEYFTPPVPPSPRFQVPSTDQPNRGYPIETRLQLADVSTGYLTPADPAPPPARVPPSPVVAARDLGVGGTQDLLTLFPELHQRKSISRSFVASTSVQSAPSAAPPATKRDCLDCCCRCACPCPKTSRYTQPRLKSPRIRGRTRDAQSGSPLNGVDIELWLSGGKHRSASIVATTKSDTNGAFSFATGFLNAQGACDGPNGPTALYVHVLAGTTKIAGSRAILVDAPVTSDIVVDFPVVNGSTLVAQARRSKPASQGQPLPVAEALRRAPGPSNGSGQYVDTLGRLFGSDVSSSPAARST